MITRAGLALGVSSYRSSSGSCVVRVPRSSGAGVALVVVSFGGILARLRVRGGIEVGVGVGVGCDGCSAELDLAIGLGVGSAGAQFLSTSTPLALSSAITANSFASVSWCDLPR